MTKKDQAKEDIIRLLKNKSRNVKQIFTYLKEECKHEFSLTSLRRYLTELSNEGRVYSKEDIDPKNGSKMVWLLVEEEKVEEEKVEEEKVEEEKVEEEKVEEEKVEEKDMYDEAIESIKKILNRNLAVKISEKRDNVPDISWTISDYSQFPDTVNRWMDMKSVDYKLLKNIIVEVTEEPIQPNIKTNKKSKFKRYNMEERIQMKKFFFNLGADEARALELVKDVLAGLDTEENIEKTLREEKKYALMQAAPIPKKKAAPIPKKKAAPIPKKKAAPIPKKKAAPIPKEKAAPIPKEKAAPIPKEKRYTRMKALAQVIDLHANNDINDLAEKSNLIYVKNGGKDNIKESLWYVNCGVELLKSMGLLKQDKKNDSKKKRYTRINALAQAAKDKEITNVNDLAERSNQIYVKNGGKDNIKESRWYLNYGVELLSSMGLLKQEKNGKTFFTHLSS